MNVPEIYARVCEACPEARVEGLVFTPTPTGGYWTHPHFEFPDWSSKELGAAILAKFVSAAAQSLIELTWTKLLYAKHYRLDIEDGRYFFRPCGMYEHPVAFPTILEAAAARLAPE